MLILFKIILNNEADFVTLLLSETCDKCNFKVVNWCKLLDIEAKQKCINYDKN